MTTKYQFLKIKRISNLYHRGVKCVKLKTQENFCGLVKKRIKRQEKKEKF